MNQFESMNAASYGPEWASVWDEYYGAPSHTDQAIEVLAELAAGRPVLEFGVGTGRLALPLQDRQLVVHGVDNSPWMIEQLRKKPGGDNLPVTMGDFATVSVDGRFGLVVLAASALFLQPTHELQLQCFQNAKKHLDTGGLFVIEVMARNNLLAEDRLCETVTVDADSVTLITYRADVLTQELYECCVILRDGEMPRVNSSASRYSSPTELDMMAGIAGMRLRDRWRRWDRRPFTPLDRYHVSIYESIT